MYGVDGKKFQRQYKNSISDFKSWEQKPHAEDWILYPENISEHLSLDEVALSDGELWISLKSWGEISFLIFLQDDKYC